MPAKIKVLHIHTRAIKGGSGANTLLSMSGLNAAGFETALATEPDGPLVDEARRRGLVVKPIRHIVNKIHPCRDFLALLELVCLIKKENYTIVHTHNSKAGILGRAAAWLCRTPVIIHTIHSCVFKYPNLSLLQRRLFLWIEKLTSHITDKFISISEPLRQEFINEGFGNPDKFVTIYSGIELDKFKTSVDIRQKREEFRLNEGDLVVGMVARFDEGKGYAEFIRVAEIISKDVPNTRFILVGDGPIRRRIEDMAQGSGIFDRCIFTGARDDVSEIMAIFDVFVLASHYEGMGRVLLEAQARGVPVVATRAGGIPEIVKDGETGILVEIGDVNSLTRAMSKLLSDYMLRKKMGEAAAVWVDERFSAETMIKNIVNLYQEILNAKCPDCRC